MHIICVVVRCQGNGNNNTFLQHLQCILRVITLDQLLPDAEFFYIRKTELEASTCQFAQKIISQ